MDVSHYIIYAPCTKVVINRRFWHTFLTCNFQINKKAYLQTLKSLPIPPNISMTPINTKK